MKKTIAVLPGDGVGPEVTAEAVKVLKRVAETFHHTFSFRYGQIGLSAVEKTGEALPQKTIDLCSSSDAILFGAVGHVEEYTKAQRGLLYLRKLLQLSINIRPVADLGLSVSPLKPEVAAGVDIMILRELTGGIYFGEPRGVSEDGEKAFDTCVYSRPEIETITEFAFRLAAERRKKVTLVDKANVLATSRFWRTIVGRIASQHPTIVLEMMYVDNAAMQLIKNPRQFDVVLTENLFGDILSDEASMITGSLGMLPSASIGKTVSLYEPIHGSFPKAAGKNTANPVGAILSAAMMLEFSFGLKKESDSIKRAVKKTLDSGLGTKDVVATGSASTSGFGDAVAATVR